MTKDEEKNLFQIFQKNFKDMPDGIVEFGDKPDIIVTIQTGERIGIELTEGIFDEKLMSESEFRIKFNKKVIAQLECCMPFKFMLDIELDTTTPLKQSQIGVTIQGIIEICIGEFGNLQPYESKDVKQLDVDWNGAPNHVQQDFLNQGYRKLPGGVSRIHISRVDSLIKSHHPESKGGVVPDFTEEHLNHILTKKEKALKSYKNCTQQWLVIGEGGDFYSYMDKIEINKGFQTGFDRVFICRILDSEVLVLK